MRLGHASTLLSFFFAIAITGCNGGDPSTPVDAGADASRVLDAGGDRSDAATDAPPSVDSGPAPSLDAAGDAPSTADAPAAMPSAFRADGTATTAPGELGAECLFFADIIDVHPASEGEGWIGTASGEVFRRSIDAEGSPTFEFQALIGGEVSLVRNGAEVEARLFGDQPDDAAPFWRAAEVLTGVETAAYTYGGSWACEPILPGDGPEGDSDRIAPGTWTIVPVR